MLDLNQHIFPQIFCFLLFYFSIVYCGRQEEPAILISRPLLRMSRMYVASIRSDFY